MSNDELPVVFLGPSLDRQTASSILQCHLRPPARRGDIYRLLGTPISGIVLIDGIFHGEPSVWQREIRDALREGIPVLGASSMGALRGAELEAFGMTGIGEVFRMYRDGVIEGDDEVALLHGPESTNYRPLSEPLVNIRATLTEAVQFGHSAVTANALLNEAKATHYPYRSLSRLVEGAALSSNSVERHKWASFFALHRVDLKRADAVLALRSFSAASFQRPSADRHFEGSHVDTVERIRLAYRTVSTPAGPISGEAILSSLDAGDFGELRDALHTRFFVATWARMMNLECPAAAAINFTRSFCKAPLLVESAAPSSSDLRERGMTTADWMAWSKDAALSWWVLERGAPHFGLDSPPGWSPEMAFLNAWADTHGVSPPEGIVPGPDLAAWLVARGPNYFGYSYSLAVNAFREMQVRGDLARYASGLKNDRN